MKKTIAVLLLLILAAGMVFANGEGESGSTATPEVIEGHDLGGREIVFTAWWDHSTSYGDAFAARVAWLEEAYNFKLVLNSTGEWGAHHDELFSSILAGDPVGDIVYVAQNFFAGLVAKNLIQPVEGHGVDFSQPYYHQLKREAFSFNGHEYGIKDFYVDPSTGWWFNKSLLEREGIEDIYTLMDNGEWNWDKMLEIAQKVTKDLDGDGTIDQWGFAQDDMQVLPMALIAGNGGNIVENGEFVLDSPQAIEALQYYQDLNLRHKVIAMKPEGAEWNWAYHEFGAGKIAFMPHFQWLPESQMGGVQDTLGWALFPAGPQGEMTVSYFPNETICIPSGVDNIEDILFIWDQIQKPMPEFDDPDQDEYDYLYDKFFDLESVEITQTMISSEGYYTPFVHEFFNLKQDWENLPGAILNGEKSPVAAVEEVKPVFEGKIADAFSN